MKNAKQSRGDVKLLTYFMLFACLCTFFWIIPRQISCLCDDAFISFKYARHFEEGTGLVFNTGERVEGYTNFLWTLLMAAGPRLEIPIPQFSRILSVLSAAFLIVSVFTFSRFYFRDTPYPYVSYIAPLLLALNPIFLQHLHTGLETAFFTLLTFLSFATWLNIRQNSHFAYTTGLVLGLAYLTRPEAVLWAGSFVMLDLLCIPLRRAKASECVSAVAKYGIVFAVIVTAHIAWRLSYYGAWLPNTYYAKSAGNWFWGVANTRGFLWSTGFLPVIAASVGPLVVRKKWIAGVSTISAIVFIYNMRMGGDIIFTGRFLVPLLPLIYITIQELTRIAFSIRERFPSIALTRRILLLICPVAFLILYTLGGAREWSIAQKRAFEAKQMVAFNQWVANCIEVQTKPTDTIAVVAAGVIPYYTERTFIDMLGLNDAHIARNGTTHRECFVGHQRTDVDYILDRKPEFILVPRKDQANRCIAAEYYLHESPRFLELYQPILWRCHRKPLRVFARKDLLRRADVGRQTPSRQIPGT
jgi:hypothetical protein